jgi:hypothetical protein
MSNLAICATGVYVYRLVCLRSDSLENANVTVKSIIQGLYTDVPVFLMLYIPFSFSLIVKNNTSNAKQGLNESLSHQGPRVSMAAERAADDS